MGKMSLQLGLQKPIVVVTIQSTKVVSMVPMALHVVMGYLT